MILEVPFQDAATPIASAIIALHNYIFGFLIFIFFFVSVNIYLLLKTFVFKHNTYLWEYKLFLFELSKLRFLHNTVLEIIWTFIPSIILILIAIPSFGLLFAMDDLMMDPDITIKIIGHQWYWSYEFTDNAFSSEKLSFDSYMLYIDDWKTNNEWRLLSVDNALILPEYTYIRLNITSSDVLHSWAVPSFGIKIDAVPQRINSAIIFLERKGVFFGQCSEICGVNHGFMPIEIKVIDINNFLNLTYF